jgi:1-acyl-sn-glycerol-3-phosphate acyltransferase
VPAAISGTERLFLGPLPKPRRVAISFGEPIETEALASSPEAARELVADELWPEVQREFGRLRAHPGLVAAGLAALGLGAGMATRRRRTHRRTTQRGAAKRKATKRKAAKRRTAKRRRR